MRYYHYNMRKEKGNKNEKNILKTFKNEKNFKQIC